MSEDQRHYVEIERARITYRFYGRGQWKVNAGHGWQTINAIYIPADVLHVAASQTTP